MSGMPYHLEKGPIFSVLEAFANDSLPRLRKALDDLRAGVALVDVGVVDSTTLHAGPHPTKAALAAHINEHWLGMSHKAGKWVGQAPFDPQAPTTTGHWQHYHGPVEAILRQTLIRAAEVSLGIGHNASVPADPPRRWPVEFFWKCPQPWFEGWVTWRAGTDGHGQVTVILATPADTGVVLDRPTKGRPPCIVNPPSTNDPTGKPAGRGMWVVTAKEHDQVAVPSTTPGRLGAWALPGSVWTDSGPVVTVMPAEIDGGVAAGGRRYTP